MPLAVLASHGITCEGDVLTKVGSSISWASSALLDVAQPDHFHFTVRVLDYGCVPNAVPGLIGVAPVGHDMSVKDIESCTGAFLLLPPRGDGPGAWEATVAGVSGDGQLVKSRLRFPGAGAVGPAPCFHVYFADGLILFALGDGPWVKAQLPEGALGEKEYRPCLSIGPPGVRLAVSVDARRRKRQASWIQSETGIDGSYNRDARPSPVYSLIQPCGDRVDVVDGIVDLPGPAAPALHWKRRRCLPVDSCGTDHLLSEVDCTGIARDDQRAQGEQPGCYLGSFAVLQQHWVFAGC